MGRSKDEAEKVVLTDFLYKDTGLISSFYSQIFQGDPTGQTQTDEVTDTTNGALKVGIVGIGGDTVN